MQSENRNLHIPYDQRIRPYHITVAELVCKYAGSNPSILDIGCGVGHTLAEIVARNPNVQLTALDIDDQCLAITGEKVPLVAKIKVDKIEDAYLLPDKFDVLIMSHSLEHMIDPVQTVKALMNLVKNDGIVVLAVPNPVRLTVIFAHLRKKNYVNRGHVAAWDRSHWINFLENILGLNVICYSQDYFQLPLSEKLPFLRPIELFLVKLFPWFSFSNIAVIRNSAG